MTYINTIENKYSNLSRVYTVYKVENGLLGRYYYGMTWSKKHPIDRNYLSSSSNPEFWEDYLDHPEWFSFTILSYHSNKSEALLKESQLVTKDIVLDYYSYNLFYGGIGNPGEEINFNYELLKLSNDKKLLIGELTSYQSMVKSREINNLMKKARGELTTQQKGANKRKSVPFDISRRLQSKTLLDNQKFRKLKGELTCWDKIAASKNCTLINKEPWLNSIIRCYEKDDLVHEGDCLSTCKFLWNTGLQYRHRLLRALVLGKTRKYSIKVFKLISSETIPPGSTPKWVETVIP